MHVHVLWTYIVDPVAPVLQRLLELLHCDGAAAVCINGLEQLGQTCRETRSKAAASAQRQPQARRMSLAGRAGTAATCLKLYVCATSVAWVVWVGVVSSSAGGVPAKEQSAARTLQLVCVEVLAHHHECHLLQLVHLCSRMEQQRVLTVT